MAGVRLAGITKEWQPLGKTQEIGYRLGTIDLQIGDGELCTLVGPSGCGKSTILRLIAGLETPTTGEIYIGEKKVNDLPPRDRDVAMVFQNYALYPHMTVAENLSFGLRMRGVDKSVIRERVQSVAKALGLENLLQRKPSQLSGGQQQRVALGRAIVRQPQVFLLDEPLSNLDAQLRDTTRAELKLLHRQLQTTMIYVTHDQVEAMTLADRMVVLYQGQIQQIGTPQEIYQQPANRMVATFIGNPPMNILPGVVVPEGIKIGGQVLPIDTTVPVGQPIEVGIRPEDLRFQPQGELGLAVAIKLTELLGAETLVHADITGCPQGEVLMKVANQPLGEKVYFDRDRLYFFAPTTGERLG
ncbi:MAG: sn-glycerol-3-phosphate ABC transporter ATP-binding protein UgpC [Pseudanabaenaceae cyanobacterium SKYGB_i_bin29]|nr:sn-glycerol-3-phosphate ABC transporter ATP-binding protein UgpC [Pseudanabaenaceae cyanobacterium SKYG29]MDW8420658.1 sn-glycerol-3-phosphate ABC transporter ATP-binding protein UgpC [Pseudanabaenaceae cyanobacterium SKYGB_i_bin29]